MTSSHPIAKTLNPKPRVLVVEDQWLLANMIASELQELGFDVIGPACSIDVAEDLVRTNHFSAAVLNFWLDHATTEALARDLLRRGCPVLFVTAQRLQDLSADLQACGWLQKPFSHEELATAIRLLLPERDCRVPGERRCLAGEV